MKILRWLDEHIEEALIYFFSLIMVIVIAVQVFARYIMNDSLSWSEELARYCFIWLVYLGVSIAVRKELHMRIEVAFLIVKGKGKIILSMIGNFLFLVFAVIGMMYGYEIAVRILNWGETSPALHLPIGLVYLAGPVGLGLTAIRLIQVLIKEFKGLRSNNLGIDNN